MRLTRDISQTCNAKVRAAMAASMARTCRKDAVQCQRQDAPSKLFSVPCLLLPSRSRIPPGDACWRRLRRLSGCRGNATDGTLDVHDADQQEYTRVSRAKTLSEREKQPFWWWA